MRGPQRNNCWKNSQGTFSKQRKDLPVPLGLVAESPKKDGEEHSIKLAMHSGLGFGTVPLDLMVRYGDEHMKTTFHESTTEHPLVLTGEVGGSREPHQREEELAVRWVRADLFLVIPRNSLSARLAPLRQHPEIPPNTYQPGSLRGRRRAARPPCTPRCSEGRRRPASGAGSGRSWAD